MKSTCPSIRPCEAPPAPRRAECVGRGAGRGAQGTGFSLVELVVVLTIVAITSAIALPRYSSSLGRYRVDIAARRIAADLELAKARARATGQFRNVIFSTSTATYSIFEEAALEPSSNRYRVNLAEEPFRVGFDTLTISDGTNRVTFDGFGQPSQNFSLTLSAAGHWRIVTVDRSSGAIRVVTP